MNTATHARSRIGALSLLFSLLIICGCGDDDSGPQGDQTGATLQGTVTVFEAGQAVRVSPVLASLGVPDVNVTIGSRSAVTDAAGAFSITNIPVGDQIMSLSKDNAVGTFLVADIERGEAFSFDQIQYSGGNVSTQHTGTWVGAGGSTDSSSVGQVALTMIIAQNGNSITGTASTVEHDTTSWNLVGTETGHAVSGEMSVTSTTSECASGGTYEGVFDADTLAGTFEEVHTDSLDVLCGPGESGVFRVVKQ